MRYRANKKVSRQRQHRHQQDLHQKQYVPLPFGGGHKKVSMFTKIMCEEFVCLFCGLTSQSTTMVWFDFYFMALEHILGHFGRVQLS